MGLLTAERLRSLYSYDAETGIFVRNAPKAKALGVARRERVVMSVDGSNYYAHRLAWLHVYGEWPAGGIDHINGNPGDNRIANLRAATHAQNMQNRRRARVDSQSGLIGAMPHQGAWRADIRLAGKKHFLGTFKTPEMAHQAYVEAKRELHSFGTL